jgi:ketosteroid isomerase-like protein
MKRTVLFLTLAVAIAAAVASVRHPAAASDDNAQINALYQQFTTAFRHKDLAGIMSVYVPGPSLFVFDVGPPREHVGWSNYRADWKGVFGSIQGTPAFSISELGVTISGDVAYSHSVQSFSGKMGKAKLAATVRVTDVLRKIDGKWLIVQEHVSVPVDLITMKPDPMSRP